MLVKKKEKLLIFNQEVNYFLSTEIIGLFFNSFNGFNYVTAYRLHFTKKKKMPAYSMMTAVLSTTRSHWKFITIFTKFHYMVQGQINGNASRKPVQHLILQVVRVNCLENKEPNLAFYGTNWNEKSAHGKKILDNRILLETIINPQWW